jgi:4-amino-4-deoxy-L-arabinose transferase-like glycosyltransferase
MPNTVKIKYPHFKRASFIASLAPALLILLCLIYLSIANIRDMMVPQMMLTLFFGYALFYLAPLLIILLIINYYLMVKFDKFTIYVAYFFWIFVFIIAVLSIKIYRQQPVYTDAFFPMLGTYAVMLLIVLVTWCIFARSYKQPNSC